MDPAALPSVTVRPAAVIRLRGCDSPSPDKPGECDCNSPAHWSAETLNIFTSIGHPWRWSGPRVDAEGSGYVKCAYDNTANGGRWIEATWKAPDGTLYGWYHLEPLGVCPDVPHLTAPQVGAVRSMDDGAHWRDLGIVMRERPEALRCGTPNRYFAGGVGDFCVNHNPADDHLYLFVSTYGDFVEQGISVARMPAADRDTPVGRVSRWHAGRWGEPGLHGRSTPIHRAAFDWHRPDVDAWWGPSVHWNTHLGCWVMLLNRAIDPEWGQEGIYVSFSADLADPGGWTKPQRIADPTRPDDWYPQVLGLGRDAVDPDSGTDKRVGKTARLFVRGVSRLELAFARPGEAP